MRLEIHFPEIGWLREWWRSRKSRLRALELEVSEIGKTLGSARRHAFRLEEALKGSDDARTYWAQEATTSITWNVILWHVRQRVTKKHRESDPSARFVDKPTEEEALEVLRDMWRNPPVFAPPEECKELASQIVSLNTKQAA